MSLPKYEKHVNNLYQNHSQNIMLENAFQVVKKQKKFTSSVAKEFANIFTKQTVNLIEVIKAKEER